MSLAANLPVRVTDRAVEFQAVVSNTGSEPIELTFPSGLRIDIKVRPADDPEGEPVWRWSDGRAFTQAIEHETVAPGEAVTQGGTWAHPPEGAYVVTATLQAANSEADATVSFEVTA